MTDKALIVSPSGKPEFDFAVDREMLEKIGLSIESQSDRGYLVKLSDRNQVAALEEFGYSVKYFPETNLLRVGDFVIDIDDVHKGTPVPPELEVPDLFIDDWTHYLVQVNGPPTEREISAIEEQGLEVIEPISAYGLFVVGAASEAKNLKLPFIAWTGPFKPAYRISRTLLKAEGIIRFVNVGIYPAAGVRRVEEFLKGVGAAVEQRLSPSECYYRDYWSLIIELDARDLVALARLPWVRWVEYCAPAPSLDSEREAQITAGNLNGGNEPVPGYQKWLATSGLSGEGVVISICDSGVCDNVNNSVGNGGSHKDLRGRQVAFKDYTLRPTQPGDREGHGTLVASIALGDAATLQKNGLPTGEFVSCGLGDQFLCGQGIAPRAVYFNQNATAGPWPPSAGFAGLTADAVINHAHIMNNSWGDEGLGLGGPRPEDPGYNSNARRFDHLVRDPKCDDTDLDSLIIVFSAGNKGPDPQTISTPHEAKNIIVVGCSLNFLPGIGDGEPDDIKGVFSESSRGPAADERILPSVVAPGHNAFGADSSTTGDYFDASGTSVSASVVSGVCALFIEWWLRNVSSKRPSPAMMKAVLINSAVDLFGGPDGASSKRIDHIPSNIQGWGRVNLANMISGKKLFFDQDHVFTATDQRHTFRVEPRTNDPLMITLVWTDAPGAVRCSPELVNDLDLRVTDDTGNVFNGNVFDASTGFSRRGGLPDRLNNIECVYIKDPIGIYKIEVIAFALKRNARPPFDFTPWQDFALVIENAETVG